jgi:hypothetical protein
VATSTKSVEEVSREEVRRDCEEYKRNALRKRLEEAREKGVTRTDPPEPVKEQPRGYGPTGIFPMVFIDRCAKLYRDKLITFVEQWDDAAHDYLDWLELEGFTQVESVGLLNAALEKADLDMGPFPVC